MAKESEVIENPVTGERFSILKSSRDTHGQLLQLDFFMQPNGFVAGEHIHPQQIERFQVLAGTLCFRINGREQIIKADQEALVPAGTPHVWWNDGEAEAHLLIEFQPALRTQAFFETFFGLARDGKTDKHGRPNLFQSAVLAQEYQNEMQPALLRDKLVFGALLPLVAPLGRLLGYQAHYPQYARGA